MDVRLDAGWKKNIYNKTKQKCLPPCIVRTFIGFFGGVTYTPQTTGTKRVSMKRKGLVNY